MKMKSFFYVWLNKSLIERIIGDYFQLLHNLHNFVVSASAILVDVGESNLNLTFAVSGLQFTQLPKSRLTAVKKLSAFGHNINLVRSNSIFYYKWFAVKAI